MDGPASFRRSRFVPGVPTWSGTDPKTRQRTPSMRCASTSVADTESPPSSPARELEARAAPAAGAGAAPSAGTTRSAAAGAGAAPWGAQPPTPDAARSQPRRSSMPPPSMGARSPALVGPGPAAAAGGH